MSIHAPPLTAEQLYAQECILHLLLDLSATGVELGTEEMDCISRGRGAGIDFCRAIRNRFRWMDLGTAHAIWQRCLRAADGAMNA